MANEIRLRRNNLTGTITDNPLGIGATTINSAGFASLPTVDATNHLILILDPQAVGGPPEIVRVTAHTAAATSVTVVRGQEGSVARSMVFNTTWMFGPVASDYSLSDVTSGTRPSVPYTGELIVETDTKKLMGYTGTDWAPRDAGGTLGYAQVTTNQGSITGIVDLTGLTVTVPVGTGRRIKITGECEFQSTSADDTARLLILQDGVVVQTSDVIQRPANVTSFVVGMAILSPSAGSHTYKLQGQRVLGVGTVTMTAGATLPAFILVEDIGAV